MEFIRVTWCLLTVLQLVEISLGKSIRGKVRSSTEKEKKGKHKTDKAVYGQLYEDTKNDVNRAIENAILEASQKATDMVLEPKAQSHIMDQMKLQMKSEMDKAGSGEANSEKDEESAIDNKAKDVTKKHHKQLTLKQPKEATRLKSVSDHFIAHAHRKTTEKKSDGSESKDEDDHVDTAVVSVDEDEGSTSDDAPKKEMKVKVKHVKKFKPKEKEEELSVIDATESSAAEPAKDSLDDDDDKTEAEDDDEPEEEVKPEEKEKSEVLPPITEAKAESAAPAAVEAKDDEEGQEDLKQLLDESITNLIKANSAVEVLLRATNQRVNAEQQPCIKDKKTALQCNGTLAVPPPSP